MMADCSDGQKNFSSSDSAIPLSPYYLYSSIRTGYETVELDWFSMEGADSYRVYRSTDRDGNYDEVSGLISRTYYSDKNLTPGQQYFYRIAPSIEGSIISELAYASPNGMKLRPEIIASASTPLSLETGEPDLLLELIVEGDYVYGLLQYGGLIVYDVSTPFNPRKVFTERYTVDETVHFYTKGKLAVYDDYLYVSCSSTGVNNGSDTLLIYSISNPGAPELVNTLAAGWDFSISDLITYNDYLYIGAIATTMTINPDTGEVTFSSDAYVNVLDITNPENVTFSDSDPYLNKNQLLISGEPVTDLNIEGMMIHNGRLYLSNNLRQGTYLYAYDFALSTTLAYYGKSTGPSNSVNGGVYVEGEEGSETAYILGGNKCFQVLDMSVSGSITETASYNEILNPQGMAICNGYAYITYGSGTLQYIGLNGSLDDNTNYFTISNSRMMGTNGSAQDIVCSDGYLWIADGSAGLTVIEPASFGTVTEGEVVSNSVKSMIVDGDYAYIAAGLNGVKIMSVSESGNLSELTMVDPVNDSLRGTGIVDLAVPGNYLYAACTTETPEVGLYVYDIENPEKPKNTGAVLTFVKNLDVAGSLIFAVSDGVVFIFDSSDPENSEIISSFVLKGSLEIKVRGDYLYVYYSDSDIKTGIAVVNMSDPYQPRITGSCNTGVVFGVGSAEGVFTLIGDYAYIGKDEGWNFWETDYSIYGIDTDGRYLYLSINTSEIGTDQKLAVLDCLRNENPVLVFKTEAGSGSEFCLLDGERISLQTGSSGIRNYNLNY